MTPKDLETIKAFFAVASAAVGVCTSLATIIGTWAVVKWRIGRLEKVIFGNGTKGLIERMEKRETKCAAFHGLEALE